MISRTTYDLKRQHERMPKRVYCWYPRDLKDGRVVWLAHVWTIRESRNWEGDWIWGNYLTYDEALVNGYWYKKEHEIGSKT